MFIPALRQQTPETAGQSDLRHLLRFDPARTVHLAAFTEAVLRAPGSLTPGERELLAAMTSRENHCLF